MDPHVPPKPLWFECVSCGALKIEGAGAISCSCGSKVFRKLPDPVAPIELS